MEADSNEKIRETVRKGYAEIAEGKPGSCCGGPSSSGFAQAIGYTNEELQVLPEGSNMGLSCGNPTAVANLKAGQVVMDLGSGAGFDVFIAAKKVGPEGRAIGVDMTPEMVSKSRQSIESFTKKTNLANVEFRLGEIEHLPAADKSVDVVISNCVINLSPDKQQVWNEISRVLKPGGKACISDLALKKPLPEAIIKAAAALIGCVAGAVTLDETIRMAKEAGLVDISVNEKPHNVDVMIDCNDPLYRQVIDLLPKGFKVGDYIISADITAYKAREQGR